VITIKQWIERRSAAWVRAGFGQWVDSPESALGRPIYRVADGPVTFIFSELGFVYDGPPASFECEYSEVERIEVAPIREIMPKEGDLLPRSDLSRLLTITVIHRDVLKNLKMNFPLKAHNLVASVLPRIVEELV